jgi:two-component system, OmpR family, sensor histidine kinase SenX3
VMVRDVTEASRTDRIRRDFVASASHELKTPVASIAALTETLRAAWDHDREAAFRFLELLEGESERLSRLVGDLLDLSRLEGEIPERVPIQLDRVVGEEAARVASRCQQTHIRLVRETPDVSQVQGVASDLGLLVHNLLDNAIRYTPPGGEIRVSLTAKDGTAELRVSDTGMGIPSSDVDRIFERFYRGDPGRSRETGGTGLGLAIVKHVAESHGGAVSVQSVLGAGSTFTVRLPMASGQAQAGT